MKLNPIVYLLKSSSLFNLTLFYFIAKSPGGSLYKIMDKDALYAAAIARDADAIAALEMHANIKRLFLFLIYKNQLIWSFKILKHPFNKFEIESDTTYTISKRFIL